jgi:thiamine-phosphate diphosphorylase
MLRCYVTDRRRGDVLECAARAVKAGVDIIQVREKDLPASELFQLVARIKDLAAGTTTKVLVNDRLDVAIAAEVDGVHLPEDGLPVRRVRPYVHVLGASVHGVERAKQAAAEGADFVIFGPVFATPGKEPVGLDALRGVVCAVQIPVLAIGGVTAANTGAVLQAGAAGIAAIRLFQRD